MKYTLLAALLFLFGATPLLAQTPWIHVAVHESGHETTRVNVNLPLAVVRIALRAAPDDLFADGKIHLDHVDEDFDVETLRELWAELRLTGDAELVTVEDDDDTIRVWRQGDLVLVDIDERRGRDPDRVRVEIPVRVVDALFAGQGETLDIERAFDELSKERGELVNVDDGETRVRVWIDERD